MDTTNIKWLPAIPNNPPFDVHKRIETLRSCLDPNNPHYQPERQHVNIKAAIKLYEDGELDGIKRVSIMDGKIVPKEETFKGPFCSWTEGRSYQFGQKQAYGQGPFNLGFHEVSINPFFIEISKIQIYFFRFEC